VESVRGPGGGYRLARPIEAIRIAEILTAVDENMDALSRGAGAHGGDRGTREQQLADRFWEQLSANVYVLLHQTRLGDVVADQLVPCPAVGLSPVERARMAHADLRDHRLSVRERKPKEPLHRCGQSIELVEVHRGGAHRLAGLAQIAAQRTRQAVPAMRAKPVGRQRDPSESQRSQ
jgi:hypothetical protein